MWKNECSKFTANKATRIVNKCGYLSVAPNWGVGDGDGMVRNLNFEI
jgi:hypothetical protein